MGTTHRHRQLIYSTNFNWNWRELQNTFYFRYFLVLIQLYFHPQPTLGVASSDSALLYAILSPVGGYFDKNKSAGVSLLADPRFTRAWPGGVGDRKMGSNYAPTIHVQKEATSKGLQQVLWLYGEDHQLTEVGTMNIFMFFINDDGGNCDGAPDAHLLHILKLTSISDFDQFQNKN